MKDIDNYIQEKLRINQDTKVLNHYTCRPKNCDELRKIIKERLEKDKDADLNDIDISGISSFKYKTSDGFVGLFYELNPYDIKIDKWDVSNIEYMGYTFYGCVNLNCDISNWNVSNVTNMSYMFKNCKSFNCDLSNWNVRKVKTMTAMFYRCDSLKKKPSWYKE